MCEKHVCLCKPKCINAVHVNQGYTHAAWAKHNTHGTCGNYAGIILGLLIANDILELLWNNLGIIENNLE